MRILYHHRTRAEDGQAVHIRALQRAFVEEGHELEEVALVKRGDEAAGRGPAASAPSAQAEAEPPSRLWSLVARLPRWALELAEYTYGMTAKGKLVRAARRFEPDFLYERYAFGNLGGVLAARKLKLPLVLEVNSPMVLELSKTRGLAMPELAARVERYIFSSADLVCAVTEVLAEMVVELGADPARVVVTPNGVHPELYDQPDRAAARADLRLQALAPGELVLGFVGYYRTWHRLDLVLRSLVAPGLESARLVLIGDGPAREELELAAAELGVTERVHFAGSRPHDAIPGLLPAFDVALVPAINPYASPLKLHEYMAAGLAVLAPDQPNLREVLRDGENALLVQPGDEASLTAAIQRLAGDPALRERLGSAARRTLLERDLTWRGNAKRVVRAVEALRGA